MKLIFFCFSGDEAKSAWAKLRNNHRDALRRQQRTTKSGAAATDIKRWKFQSQMEFLLCYMNNEKRDTNFKVDDDVSEPPLEERSLEFETERPTDHDGEITTCEDSSAPRTDVIEENDPARLLVRKNPVELPTPRPKKKVKKIDVDKLIKETVEQREQRSKERREEREALKDDLRLFFMAMYEQTKKMPAASQHIVKKNIFNAVSEEEGRLLNISDSVASSYQPFPPGIGLMNINRPSASNWSDFCSTDSPASSCSSQRPPSHPSTENSDIVTFVTRFSE